MNWKGVHRAGLPVAAVLVAATVVWAQVPITLEAERDLAHQIGRAEADGWSVNTNDPPNHYLSFGPQTEKIPPGVRQATFRLMLDNVDADDLKIVSLDVYDAAADKILVHRGITRKEFKKAGQYQEFTLPFQAAAGQKLEFRTYWHYFSYVRQDNVTVR